MLPEIKREEVYVSYSLPSGKAISARPWKIKEEKALLFNLEGKDGDADSLHDGVVQMVRGCVEGKDATKFDNLSEVDLLFLVQELRKRSKGEKVEFQSKCPHCGIPINGEVDLSKDVTVKKMDTSDVELAPDLTVTLTDLSLRDKRVLAKKFPDSVLKHNYNYVLKSVAAVHYKGETFDTFTTEELERFFDETIGNMDVVKKLYQEVEAKQPDIYAKKTVVCMNPNCRKEVDVVFEDLYDFFVF